MKKIILVVSIVTLSSLIGGKLLIAEDAATTAASVPQPAASSAEVAKTEPAPAPKEVKVLFGFEDNLQGWEIPDWCFEKEDYVGKKIAKSDKYTSEGKSSLEMTAAYPGGIWTAAYCEIMQYLDLTGAKAVATDVYLPADAPNGLKAKMIVTWGEDWTWTEMSRSVALEPGKWVTIEADMTNESNSWRGVAVDDKFRGDIRKLGVRIESNMRPVYSGPIYIDNVRIIK